MAGWEPLFAIADQAGGNWPQRARDAVLALNSPELKDDQSLGVQLLSDIRMIFAEGHIEKITPIDLAASLAHASNPCVLSNLGGFLFQIGGGVKVCQLSRYRFQM